MCVYVWHLQFNELHTFCNVGNDKQGHRTPAVFHKFLRLNLTFFLLRKDLLYNNNILKYNIIFNTKYNKVLCNNVTMMEFHNGCKALTLETLFKRSPDLNKINTKKER